MRVLLVHASRLDKLGGAEISLKNHVDHAPDGVTVDVVLPNEVVDLRLYDAVILANLRPSAGPSNGTAKEGLKSWIWKKANNSPFQMLVQRSEVAWTRLWRRKLQGYRGFVVRSERDLHPCASRDMRCLNAVTMERTACGTPHAFAREFERLYNYCDAVQFLSPLHRRAINTIVKIDVPQFEIASPLNRALFRDYTPANQRKNAALLLADAIRCGPEAERRARQAGFEVERLDYLSVPYEQMPKLLNEYRAVIVDPVMLHAFGRLAVEAIACGCQLLASERVGALSWPDPLAACDDSNARFWEMVTNNPGRPNPMRLAGSALRFLPQKRK